MKAMMISIRPEWTAKILNKEKTIEIRKRFPKDYVGWVYIYCTKEEYLMDTDKGYFSTKNGLMEIGYYYKRMRNINGKVVARFWCDKVETFRCIITGNLKDGFFKAKPYCKVIEDGIANYNCDDEFEDILKNAQITNEELAQYLGDKREPYGGWYVFNAIHITQLEIFDKPKEISEFYRIVKTDIGYCVDDIEKQKPITLNACKHLTRAPESWQFIEV